MLRKYNMSCWLSTQTNYLRRSILDVMHCLETIRKTIFRGCIGSTIKYPMAWILLLLYLRRFADKLLLCWLPVLLHIFFIHFSFDIINSYSTLLVKAQSWSSKLKMLQARYLLLLAFVSIVLLILLYLILPV